MSLDPRALPTTALDFVAERHLATLTTLRADGSPHVTPVGFTGDGERCVARVITSGTSTKARNVARGGRAALRQVEGWRWLTLEGPARLLDDPDTVHDAEQRYAARYRVPCPNPRRVVIEIVVDRALGLLNRPTPRPR